MAKDDRKVLIIAQEIKLTKILAGNNAKLRERTLKRLGSWLVERVKKTTVTETENVFLRLWKGLFYSMWMSDKPLVQEACAENIAKLIHFDDTKTSLVFFKCFLQTMVNEWFGIDHHRIDKFLMLIRRVFRQAFEVLKQAEWSDDHIKTFRETLNQTALKIDSSSALGLILHIDEVFLEELAKVSRGKISPEVVLELIQPFVQQLARLDDIRHVKHVNQHIFKYLIDQSDVGIEYKEKFHIWRRQGFPGGTMDSLEKVEVDNPDLINDGEEEDEEDGPKDPRAGKIDVVLPQLQFDPLDVVALLSGLRFKSYTTSLGRKQIGVLIQQFQELSKGTYPLGSTKVATLPQDGYKTDLKSSVKRLNQLENKISSKHTKRAKKREAKQKKVKEILQEHVEQLIKDNKLIKPKKKPSSSSASTPIIKKEKVKVTEFSEDSEEFQTFVAKSEAKLMDKLRKNKRKTPDNPPDLKPNKKKPKNTVTKSTIMKPKINTVTKQDLLNTSEINLEKIPTKNPNTFVRNSGMWVVEEFDLPESPKKQKTSSSDEWSKPLQNGETEYFVVASKMKKKLKRLADNNKSSPLKRPDDLLQSNTIKNRTPKIVKNPFATTSPESVKFKTPKSEKKIKFSDKNHAQDFSDHLKQIMSSPGIPYDSKKKPIKPLLKPSPISSPLNPFYRKLK